MAMLAESEKLLELEAIVQSLQTSVRSLEHAAQQGKEETLALQQRLAAVEKQTGMDLETAAPAAIPVEAWQCSEDHPVEKEDATSKESCGLTWTLEYNLGETVWDGAVFLGLPELGLGCSAVLLVSVLLNVVVQTYIVVVLLRSDSFNNPGAFAAKVPYMDRWRFTVAHDYREMDASGSSLASRVCRNDQSLSVAGGQANLLSEINAYLDGKNTGVMLCTACLFLFVVSVVKEVRLVLTLMHTLYLLPRGQTLVKDNTFVSISCFRLAMIQIFMLARLVVAVLLLWTGVVWLSQTSSTTDLILNAAALCFIMDLDEILFETTVPFRVQSVVRSFEPLRLHRPPFHMEAIFPLVSTLIIVAVAVLGLVEPQVSQMIRVREALCSGLTDFVVTENPAGIRVSRETQPFDNDTAAPHFFGFTRPAVDELRNATPTEDSVFEYSVWYPLKKKDEFVAMATMGVAEMATEQVCADADVWADGLILTLFPSFFVTVRYRTGLHSGKPLSEIPFRCAEYFTFCDTTELLRLLCPVTCGCNNPVSGLLLSRRQRGCPSECEVQVLEALRSTACVDADVSQSTNWTRYWKEYSRQTTMQLPKGELRDSHAAWVDLKIAGGCADASPDPVAKFGFCDDEHQMFVGAGFASILGFCPATCCNGTGGLPKRCEHACPAGASGGAGARLLAVV